LIDEDGFLVKANSEGQLREQLADPATCPENRLLWFHHLPWDHGIPSSLRHQRASCLLYFQLFSRRPRPAGLEPLEGTRDDHRNVRG